MDDVKSAFGLGGSTSSAITNIKNDLLSLATLIENTLLPKIEKMSAGLNEAAKNFGSVVNSSKSSNLLIADKHGRITGEAGDKAATADGNRVAPAPAFSDTKQTPSGNTQPAENNNGNNNNNNNNRVAASANFASVIAGVGYAANALSAALPSTQTSVLQDYMTVRSGFYGIGGYGGSQQDQSRKIHDLQKQLANQGTMNDSIDSTKAIYAGQKLGLTGYTNFASGKNSIASGAAAISNLEPGLGGVGAMEAQASLAKPTAVNMLRTIGISMVDAKGNLTTTPQLIDQIWDFIMRADGPKALTEAAIQFEATPGHGLYVMLSKLFQGNPEMIQIVVDGLIMKARAKGASVANLTRSQMQKLGGTSATVNKIAGKTAAQTDLLVNTAANTSAGYGASADLAKALNRFADLAPGLVGALGSVNGFLEGFKAIGGGFLSQLLGILVANKITGAGGVKAAGGAAVKTAAEAAAGGTAVAAGATAAAGTVAASGGGYVMGKGAKIIGDATGLNNSPTGRKISTAGGIATGAALGATVGASIGSVVPIAGTAAGAVIGTVLGAIGGWFGAREKGGPTNAKTPYIVGEKGPELFVPKIDGVIVPNGITSNLGRKDGGPVKKGGAPTTGEDLTKYLMSQGYTQAGAEGIVGNLTWESGLNTKALGDKGTSFGLAQWHAGRWKALNKFAAGKHLDPSSAAAQEQFLAHELQQKQYKHLNSVLKDPKASKVDAAGAFMREFERPANTSNSMAVKRANAYSGKLGLTAAGTVTDSNAGSSFSGSTSAGTSSSSSDMVSKANARAQGAWEAIGGGTTGDFHNHGGVTVNINAQNQSHESIIKMFTDLFTSKGIIAKIAG